MPRRQSVIIIYNAEEMAAVVSTFVLNNHSLVMTLEQGNSLHDGQNGSTPIYYICSTLSNLISKIVTFTPADDLQ